MKPGRELDALVAEKVMGWKKTKKRWQSGVHAGLLDQWIDGNEVLVEGSPASQVPKYSTEIAAAWEVVEKMRTENYFTLSDGELSGGEWAADFSNGEGGEVRADTAPHAICLAALKAVGAL